MTAELFTPPDYVKGVQMTKADIAAMFGETMGTVDNWVRQGCPCERSGAVRSPLIFDSAKVHFWRCVFVAHQEHGEHIARLVRSNCERGALEGALWRAGRRDG